MEVVQLVRDRLLTTLVPLLVEVGDPFAQTTARITHHMLQLRQAAEFGGPCLAAERLNLATADPAEAVRLNRHEYRLLDVHFVDHRTLDPWAGLLIDYGEQSGRACCRGLGPATQLGDTGGLLTQQHAEQVMKVGQADAFRLADGGELGLFVLIHDDCLGELRFELGHPGFEGGNALLQGCGVLALGSAVQGSQHGSGFAVEALAGDAALDGTVRAEMDGVCTGNLLGREYDAHEEWTPQRRGWVSSHSLQVFTPQLSTPNPCSSCSLRKCRNLANFPREGPLAGNFPLW